MTIDTAANGVAAAIPEVAAARNTFGPRDNESIPLEWGSWILTELRARKAALFRQLLLDACANFMLDGPGK